MPDAAYLAIYGRPLGGSIKRRPTPTMKAKISEQQKGCCLYCGLKIGSLIRRRGVTKATRPSWDHFIPHSFLAANPMANWVLACHICNSIKGRQVFETVAQAQLDVKTRWLQMGYEEVSAIR